MIDYHPIVFAPISIKFINKSFCDYLIDAKQMSNTLFTNFSTELKKQIGSYII